ncbi:MAG: polyprenyl synthetase family protein [Planctomycetota bacterium]
MSLTRVAIPHAKAVPQSHQFNADDLRLIIDEALDSAAKAVDDCTPPRLAEAMRYSLLAPGKRLRPMLVLMAAEVVAGPKLGFSPDVIAGAVAVEMVHAYSLVHDDLPAMDDDDLRRGRPTTHIAFDEATAILAGDGLLTQAFVHLSEHVENAERRSQALASLARASSSAALVGGQIDDLASERDPELTVGWDENERLVFLESIHRRKTGALFSVSLELGAVLGGADSEVKQVLIDYSLDVGLAFQVVDDLLDWTSTPEQLGKQTGKDDARGKLTYPGLMGIEAAKAKADALISSALQHLDRLDHLIGDIASRTTRLRELAKYVAHRRH